MGPPRLSIPVLIVLLFCLVFAVRLGALQPETYFQKVDATTCGAGGSSYAYASENALLFKLPHAQDMGARALFLGNGIVSSVSYDNKDQTSNVTKIMVNGNVACSPCIAGRKYPAEASGDVAVEVFAEETPLVAQPTLNIV